MHKNKTELKDKGFVFPDDIWDFLIIKELKVMNEAHGVIQVPTEK